MIKSFPALILMFLIVLTGTGFLHAELPHKITDDLYAEPDSCIECHATIHRQWMASDHAHSMAHADETSVLGDFNDVTFRHIGFDDILLLTDEEVQTLVHTVASVPVESDRMLAYTDKNIPGGKFRVSQTVQFDDFALALRDAKTGVAEKLTKNMSESEKKELQAESEFLEKLHYTHPGEISAAQNRIESVLRQLFEDKRITTPAGTPFRMYRENGKYMTDTDLGMFEVRFTLGIRPLQQYLVLLDGGRIQCLPTAWNSAEKRWYHLYPKEQILKDDPLHWSKPLQNWNYMCADCHTTRFSKNFNPQTQTYDSAFTEIHVGCQSCHGPCGKHVTAAKSHGFKTSWDAGVSKEVFLLSQNNPQATLGSCALCHTRRHLLRDGTKPPEQPVLDWFIPEMMDQATYYPDGQLLEEAFEFGSFTQAKMYHKGVTCTNCHEPHKLTLRYEGNKLCTQCHSPMIYDTVQHHFHKDAARPGTMCVECHFPQSDYMVADSRRDHSIRKPSPDLTLAAGVPNACSNCHHDRQKGETVEWAAKQVHEWYAHKRESMVGYSQPIPAENHYAHGIREGRAGLESAVPKLIETFRNKSDRDYRPAVRASALKLLGQFPTQETLLQAMEGLKEEDALVRLAAVSAMELFSPELRAKSLPPLLGDPLLAVRCEAARLLADVTSRLNEKDRSVFEKVRLEYVAAQRTLNDHPASYLNLAVFEQNIAAPQFDALNRWVTLKQDNLVRERKAPGDPAFQEVETAYLETVRKLTVPPLELYTESLKVDAGFIPSRINLAMLYNQRGEPEKAERQFREVLRIDPKHGETHYSLGLLLSEQGKLQEALAMFQQAAKLVPENPRIAYNYGLLLMQLGRLSDAEKTLQAALAKDAANPSFLYAMAVLSLQQNNGRKALESINRLLEQAPTDPQWLELKRMAESLRQR
ncbi:MAG: tetratricopeptide repeat protein [Planctomycetaceae bacterium]|nr:tetratricopeptide repeat protein [Planctomycetaceae bacterium]